VAVLMATYQACLLAAIALTSPTFVALGTMLAVPTSIAYDFAFKGYVVPSVALGGIVAIIISFATLVFADRLDELLDVAKKDCAPARPPPKVNGASGTPALV